MWVKHPENIRCKGEPHEGHANKLKVLDGRKHLWYLYQKHYCKENLRSSSHSQQPKTNGRMIRHRNCTERELQTANKHRKMCPTTAVKGKMQIKQQCNVFWPSEWQNGNTANIQSYWGCRGRMLTLIKCCQQCNLIKSFWGAFLAAPQTGDACTQW